MLNKFLYSNSAHRLLTVEYEVQIGGGGVDLTVYYIRQQHLLTTHTLVISFDVVDRASVRAVPNYSVPPPRHTFPCSALAYCFQSVTSPPLPGRVWTQCSATNHRQFHLDFSAILLTGFV